MTLSATKCARSRGVCWCSLPPSSAKSPAGGARSRPHECRDRTHPRAPGLGLARAADPRGGSHAGRRRRRPRDRPCRRVPRLARGRRPARWRSALRRHGRPVRGRQRRRAHRSRARRPRRRRPGRCRRRADRARRHAEQGAARRQRHGGGVARRRARGGRGRRASVVAISRRRRSGFAADAGNPDLWRRRARGQAHRSPGPDGDSGGGDSRSPKRWR